MLLLKQDRRFSEVMFGLLQMKRFIACFLKVKVFGCGQYLVGDWNGDGQDNIAVRRGHVIIMDYNFDGVGDQTQYYGHGT